MKKNQEEKIVTLSYKQRETKPHKFIERFGIKELVCDSGFIDYDQEEKIEESKVTERVKELKSFSNRKYHTFVIK
jgi:hypothetical protein